MAATLTAPPLTMAPEKTGRALTARERECAILLAQGLTNEEIAKALGISYHTAKFHVQNCMTKLDVFTRTAVAVYAIRNGLTL